MENKGNVSSIFLKTVPFELGESKTGVEHSEKDSIHVHVASYQIHVANKYF